MHRLTWTLVLSLLAVIGCAGLKTSIADDGFVSIFDGKTLEGWDGDPKFWKVEDGAITGRTTKENPTKGNTFIIWKAGQTADFELKLQYKIIKGNSGIQYRSFKAKGPDEWRIGGYQADFEAGKTYSGILYGERFRGILANRGQKTVIGDNGKPTVVGKVGDSAEIQKAIKHEDWNDYHIIAKGYHFVHKINGVVTMECTDEDKDMRRADGLLALQLHAGPPMTVQFRNIRIKHLKGATSAKGAQGDSGKKKIVFVAGRKSHGWFSHEHIAGSKLLADQFNKSGLPVETVVVTDDGYPKDPSVFDGADTVVVYCDGGGRHLLNKDRAAFDKIMKKGVGLVCIHYGVETTKGENGDAFLNWIGGYFEPHWSVNPHWTAKYAKLPDHPITRGVKPFDINDEWYYHMRFRPNLEGVTPILTAMPGPETLKRKDGAHSGNPHVREAVLKRKEAQHMGWAYQRGADYNHSRGFGFTGGHNHINWGNDDFRRLVLNAIAWTAKMEIPASGIPIQEVTAVDLEKNQDYNRPGNWNTQNIQNKLNAWNGTSTKVASATPAVKAGKKGAKPLFKSKVVSKNTPGHAVDIDVNVKGSKQIYLVANDGGDGFGCDWVAWVEPRFVDAEGKEIKLTDLKWKKAVSGHGSVQVNKNSAGKTQLVNDKPVAYGIGTHAPSLIVYDVPAGAVQFKAQGALDNGGTKQGCGSTVGFMVFNQAPGASVIASKVGGVTGGIEAAESLQRLEVGEGLQATVFANEPMLLSPSNVDIDHLGRVWVCEIVNYRKHKNTRNEGDRILILEDTDADGKADKQTTFYQGRDIDSPHGVCVLATPDGKNTKVIVSAGDKVYVFTDADGDLKADDKKVLFSGISGTQHDHGIHAFVFGPDGKLYFNFGNSGNQIKDASGKLIVDMAGNEVAAKRKPYQQGMVFRCNLDGSEFETLGWNFRNNWMATVDSFGSIWQSDNDDDGNRAVRINYVMEFGNYGYRDEFTGAGWRDKRTNMEKEIPDRHWHLNDPGVVPNLLQTGAGSPTGIVVYEGDLLPKRFHGQVIHCDAGPNVVRAYPVKNDGAGYSAEIDNVLRGVGDKWFRPSDVAVAPDGSLIVADWYDPGVGGHNMRDLERGRLFRITPTGHQGYKTPKFDFSTADGAVEALKNPNYAVRYVAWQALHKMGAGAEGALKKLWGSSNPRYRARALWLLGKIPGKGQAYVDAAMADGNSDIRIAGLRLARQLKDVNSTSVAAKLAKDPSPQVRREVAVAIRFDGSHAAHTIWCDLASQHDGKDRWYLEALGIGSDLHADARLACYLMKNPEPWKNAAGRDIVWRVRAKAAPALIVKALQDPATPKETHPRYMRALDFHKGPEKDKALQSLLGL